MDLKNGYFGADSVKDIYPWTLTPKEINLEDLLKKENEFQKDLDLSELYPDWFTNKQNKKK